MDLFSNYPNNHFMWSISSGGGSHARSQLSSLVFITYPITDEYTHVCDRQTSQKVSGRGTCTTRYLLQRKSKYSGHKRTTRFWELTDSTGDESAGRVWKEERRERQ